MSTTLVDSNVILDIFTESPQWSHWSATALGQAIDDGDVAINPIIYAEISIRFDRIEALEEALPSTVFRRLPLPWEAGFLAGKCFVQYRQRGGARRSPLPDFYIGAHAAVSELTLLTRDPVSYRDYFPKLTIISPPIRN